MEARTDIAAGSSEHHLADLGFDDQGFGLALMIDDDLRIVTRLLDCYLNATVLNFSSSSVPL